MIIYELFCKHYLKYEENNFGTLITYELLIYCNKYINYHIEAHQQS